ncbi:MAG: PA1571 family protein [Paraperlucidibaca sp.]
MNTVNVSHTESHQYSNAFQFAVLVDEQGRETAITEEMIQRACADLAKRCHFPENRQAA